MYSSLLLIKDRLNQYLQNISGSSEDLACLSSKSNLNSESQSQIAITIVNVEKEVLSHYQQSSYITNTGVTLLKHPPLHLNLYLLISSDFGDNNYEESLKYLEMTMRYFQSNPVLDRHSAPELGDQIDKLTLELVDMNFHDLSQVWNLVGGNYVPSAVYKLRMISIEPDGVAQESKQVDTPSTNVSQ